MIYVTHWVTYYNIEIKDTHQIDARLSIGIAS